MSIETRINMLSNRLSDVNKVIGPNNLNSAVLSSISTELDLLEKEGVCVLNLRNNYGLLQAKVRTYQQMAQISSRGY